MTGTTTWKDLLVAAEARLPVVEARRILEEASGYEPAELVLHLDDAAPPRACHRALRMVERRTAGRY